MSTFKDEVLDLIKRMSDSELQICSSLVKVEQDMRQRYPREQPINNESPDRRNARAVPRMDFERVPVAKDTVVMGTGISDVGQESLRANYQEKLHVDTSGATSSHIPLRYDLIPRQLLYLAALRYTEGVEKHGERGYQRGFGSRDFILNRINHIYEHLNSLFHPLQSTSPWKEPQDTLDGNLGAIIWGIGFIAEVSQHDEGAKILGDIIANGRVKST